MIKLGLSLTCSSFSITHNFAQTIKSIFKISQLLFYFDLFLHTNLLRKAEIRIIVSTL